MLKKIVPDPPFTLIDVETPALQTRQAVRREVYP